MKIRYDKEANAAYIFVSDATLLRKKARTIPVTDDVAIDLGPKGELLGVEVLNARESIGKEGLRDLEKEKFNVPIIQYV